ncbi:MAG: sugar ABC transporter permease [Gemmiger sp.]|nr:sugar ABC transporter permease [Gemmiger sp.]
MSTRIHAALPHKKMSNLEKKEALTGYLFVTPYLIAFVIFTGIPFVSAFLLSFLNVKYITKLDGLKFVGLKNFVRMFASEETMAALGRTAIYSLIYVPVIMVLSFGLAYLLNKGVFFKKTIRSMVFLPYISNMVAVAVVFQLLLGPRGPFYLLQKFFGVEDPVLPLLSLKWALPTVVLISVWKSIGLNFLTYLGALQGVPVELVEAAQIDGASKWQQIKNVVLPAVSPTTFFLLISSIITSMQNFTVIQALTEGKPGQSTVVMSVNIVRTAFTKYETSYAAAQALVMFAIVMVITIIQWYGQKKWVNY